MFSWLDAFDPDKAAVEELKAHYRRGGLGDSVVKKRLEARLQEMIEPIRQRREAFAQDPAEVMNILKRGTDNARAVAAQTLSEVKGAMGINYFGV